MRNPVKQIAVAAGAGHVHLYALDSYGRVWRYIATDKTWFQLPDLPTPEFESATDDQHETADV